VDMRVRSDLSAYWPDGGLAVKVRIDALDNVALGSAPDGIPSASTRQLSSDSAVLLKRAYGEVLTPLGLLVAGRMGSHWGLGMLANGGDCDDCDNGDSADRIAFVMPLMGLLWAFAFDLSASGPLVRSKAGGHAIDIAPSADVYTTTWAVMRYKDDAARRRRRRAGKHTFEYGAYGSHRWQRDDVPASYLQTSGAASEPLEVTPSSLMSRGFYATAADLWLRFTGPAVRVELEAAYLHAKVEQASLIPGVLYRDPVTSN
ncbi:hypothetical protein JYT22_01230, partial [Endomicrobium sp. AH-315-J14]|nr:hypothetical protein [Endomicrobium sp. AH-315-J14]